MFYYLWIIIVLTLLTGCSYNKSPETVNMDYIKIPDEILLTGNLYKEEIIKLNNEYNKIKDDKNIFRKQEIIQKIAELTRKSTIDITDKKFIKTLLNNIHNSRGVQQSLIVDKTVSELFHVQFIYKDIDSVPILDRLKEGYISDFSIFSNGYALIPKYNKNAPDNVSFLKVKLSDNTIKYLENYYNSRVK